MNTLVAKAPSGAIGVDTITPFTAATAAKFKAGGYSFVVRYLGSISVAEFDAILNAGLGLLAVGYSRRPGWMPSAALGAQDGALAVTHAHGIGLPKGMTLYCDLEGPSSECHATDCIAYVNSWAKLVQAAGYIAGLYVGYAIPLTPNQLYHNLDVTAYWASCSRPQAVAVRGYRMTQHYPGNVMVLGVLVDLDTITSDANGDTPMWLIKAPDSTEEPAAA